MGVESKSTRREVFVEVVGCPKNISIQASMTGIHFLRESRLRQELSQKDV